MTDEYFKSYSNRVEQVANGKNSDLVSRLNMLCALSAIVNKQHFAGNLTEIELGKLIENIKSRYEAIKISSNSQ